MPMTGSEIALGGFANEQEVADKFNNWKTDKDARKWLQIMMYDLDEIVSVHADKIGQKGYKSDINVGIHIVITRTQKKITTTENIQVKLVSTASGYNQVEKRRVEQYKESWHIPDNIVELLKYYDGENKPYRDNVRDSRRMFVDEFTDTEQQDLINYLQSHIVMIVSDVIRGRGRFAAEWTLVVHKYENKYKWVLISINEAIGIYLGDCKVAITNRGNIRLGTITLQRKGGDGGRDTANMLQFKADPILLFTQETSFSSQL